MRIKLAIYQCYDEGGIKNAPVQTASVAFQVRSSSDAGDMGSWSDTLFAPGTGLTGILADSTQHLQYRVILDSSGRVVAESSQEFPMGIHSVIFEDLAEGVYFCAMGAGNFSATEKVVVLE